MYRNQGMMEKWNDACLTIQAGKNYYFQRFEMASMPATVSSPYGYSIIPIFEQSN